MTMRVEAQYLHEARRSIESCVERLRQQARYSEGKGDHGTARGIRVAISIIERDLIGGEGCVIAAFDHRIPDLIENGWLTP